MSPETLAFTYGLSSAVAWGAGDFTGGFATKQNNVFSVILVSQFVGGVFLVLLALCFGEPVPEFPRFLLGGVAGFCGVLGLVALYTGLAKGRMGIVAPLSAVVTAVLPVIVALLTEGLPTTMQLAGFGMALVAIWFLSYSFSGPAVRPGELYFPVLAGLGFGLFFIFIDRAIGESVLWPLVGARIVSVGLMSLVILIKRQSLSSTKGQMGFMVLAGIFDASGNAFFAIATKLGRLDISAVLSSFYPAGTILLAWLILKERLQWSQWVGVVIALVSLGLIAL
jgi:drug/metabolite transporter (DMT)-like permease